ncbi:MAG: O-antigen polymerase [Burkholderiales bacterium]
MTVLAALMMASLGWFAHRLARSWFAPAVIYCASWTACLATAALMGDSIDDISGEVVLVYLACGVAYVVGATAGQRFKASLVPGPIPEVWRSRTMDILLNASTLVCLALTPFFVRDLMAAGGFAEIVMHLRDVRAESVETSNLSNAFSFFRNLPVLIQVTFVLSMYASRGTWRSRLRSCTLAVLWAATGIIDGSKLVALQLPFFFVCTVAIRERRVPWRLGVGMAGAFLLTFALGILFSNFGYLVGTDIGVEFNVLGETLGSYIAGGVVGFSKFYEAPDVFGSISSPLRVPMGMINGLALTLGSSPPFQLESVHAQFVALGPNIEGNTYTALFSYDSEGSLLVAMVWVFIVGALSGTIFRACAVGRRWGYFVYPWVAYAAFMSAYSEQFFHSSQVAIKWVVLGLGFHLLALSIRRAKQGEAVPAVPPLGVGVHERTRRGV